MSNQNTSSVIFVCWGNICRSPMAEFVARKVFSDEGLDARITSAGVSDEEHGGPMDSRARSVLKSHGYPCSGHNAHQIDESEIMSADLVIAAEPRHIQMMKRMAPTPTTSVSSATTTPNAPLAPPCRTPGMARPTGSRTPSTPSRPQCPESLTRCAHWPDQFPAMALVPRDQSLRHYRLFP